ncbi:hypothetical protein [Bacillus pseudomycoides]|uniref:hypothetical protein n=1 Tax=Bacillus pseudomycoides TaxID=64104 RepID=UPI000BF7BDA4|nr:hypothetical protein [Bacillus pseudomycoides]PGC41910.1 hypothetical protein COM18_09650 [Bacillus pseudomycoides]
MIPLLKYRDSIGNTLEVKFILGSMYFVVTDKIGRFVHCVFLGNRAREFVRILSGNERTEVLDKGDDIMCFQPFKGGGFGIIIDSKGMSKGCTIDRQQTEELINWCQKIHKF